MAQTYLTPGVYVEEVDAGPQPIEGVSTSITGAVGVTAFGPTSGKPVLVTSFAEFQQNFGGFLPPPDTATYRNWALDAVEGGQWWQFPLAVKGFFDNGGQQLFVKRVFSSNAVAASGNLTQGLFAAVTTDAAANGTAVQLQHLFDVFEGQQLQFFRGDTNAQIGGNFTVSTYSATTRQVTLTAALPAPLVSSRGDYAVIHAHPAPDPVTLTFSANSFGDWGSALSVQVAAMIGATMSIVADPTIANNAPANTSITNTVNNAGPPPTTTITLASSAGFQNNDHVMINGLEYTLSNQNNNDFTLTPPAPGGLPFANNTAIKRLRAANVGGAGNTINVWAAPSLYTNALVQLDTGHRKETFTVTAINGNTLTLSGQIANTYYEGALLYVVEASVTVNYNPADGSPAASESFTNLRLYNDNSISYLVNFINQQSQFVTVAAPNAPLPNNLTRFPTAQGLTLQLTGGHDNWQNLTPNDFVGVDGGSGARTGIQALEDITQLSLCIVPGVWSRTVQSALITHCESLRYRFAILDSPPNLDIQHVLAWRGPFDTKFAALYYPWIDVPDPSVDMNVSMAPSGHIAGIYARVDNDRGVYKAPANEELLSIFDISRDVNQREQALLNPVGVNALRYFPNRGYRVWGARTLSSESEWKYVNVKRIFIYVEASIDAGTQWVVFEPNDEPLWARVRQTITDFLTTTWHSGALQGSKPSEAFFVKCDHTTMTQDDIDNGKLICVIGIAPVKPAEFVIFRIQQYTQPAPAAT